MKKKAHTFLFLCFLCLCLPLSARAEGVDQPEIVTLETIIVTADRLPQPMAKSTSSVNLITEEEISEKHPTLPDEILRGMPGLSVNSSGTMGETISIRLRGGNSDQTLVLIDGMKVNSPWDGTYGEWRNTDLTDIGRIEIIKGTQSELYGSEAIGGVVHLLTKEGRKAPGFTLSVGGGTFETRKESLQVAGGEESLHYLFSTVRIDSKGQFDNDAYRNIGLTARVDWRPHQAFSLKSVSRYRNAEKEEAVNPDELFFLDPNGHQWTFFWDKEGVRIDHSFLQSLVIEGEPCPWWHYRLNMGLLRDHYRSEKMLYYNSTNLMINDVISNRLVLGTQHDFSRPEIPNTLTFGLEYEQEAAAGGMELGGDPNTIVKSIFGMDTSLFFDTIDKKRHNLSLFFQNKFEAHPLILTAGLRWDNNSVFGKVCSPRFSGALTLDKTKTRFKANWAKGFRAPAFQELYIADPLFGNPHLKPEKSTSFEAGFEQPLLNNLSIVCTYFHIDFEDLIEKGFPSRNIGAAVTKGAEGELTYHPFSKLNFQVYYTYLDSEDKEEKCELSNRPHHTWKIAANYNQGNFSVHPVVHIVSSEYYSGPGLDLQGNPTKERNPGFTRTDVSFQYEFPTPYFKGSRWQWYARINNLFDEGYYEVQGFPVPGIHFLTGIKGTF